MCERISLGGWIFYLRSGHESLDKDKCGKWMYFFSDEEFADKICRTAVENEVCVEAKHSDSSEGVCCFYLNGDDKLAHRRVIGYFIENNLIRKTKAGKFYNISFKYDNQTIAGEYGPRFNGEIKLDEFIDLNTGEWR